MAAAHQRWHLNDMRLRVGKRDAVVQIVNGQQARVQVMHSAAHTRTEQSMAVVVADIRVYVLRWSKAANQNYDWNHDKILRKDNPSAACS
jgi:hypothetical protein